MSYREVLYEADARLAQGVYEIGRLLHEHEFDLIDNQIAPLLTDTRETLVASRQVINHLATTSHDLGGADQSSDNETKILEILEVTLPSTISTLQQSANRTTIPHAQALLQDVITTLATVLQTISAVTIAYVEWQNMRRHRDRDG